MEPINFLPDLATLARHAALRELIADGVDEREAARLVSCLEIRQRGRGGDRAHPFGAP